MEREFETARGLCIGLARFALTCNLLQYFTSFFNNIQILPSLEQTIEFVCMGSRIVYASDEALIQ